MSGRALAACALAACALLAGCGGQHPRPAQHRQSAVSGTPASDAQVLMLARVLELNFEHGGARFTASLEVSGQPVVATGRVDFRSGRGTALVAPVDPGQGAPRRFFWTRRKVLAQTTPGGRRYATQVPNQQGNPVHAMIGFVNLLSAETIDNTVTIRNQEPILVGHTTIAGAAVDEFRYGRTGSTTLWILPGSGLLRRIHTTRVTGGITVNLPTHEPVRIVLPPVAPH